MSAQFNLTDVSGEELVRTLIEKVIDTGGGIKELRELVRRLVVQGEALTEMEMHFERIEQNIGSVQKFVTAALDAMRKSVDANQEMTKTLVSGVEEMKEEAVAKLQVVLSTLDKIEASVNLDVVVQHVKSMMTEISNFKEYLHRLPSKKVKNVHYLGWPLIVFIGMVLLLTLATWEWRTQYARAEQMERSDIKWRYVKLWLDSVAAPQIGAINQADIMNPDSLRKFVEMEELRRKELTDRLLFDQENRKRIDVLKKGR